MTGLSSRGRDLLQDAMPEYLSEHFSRSSDLWHATERPEGYLGLCVAENALVWDLFEERVQRPRPVPPNAFAYDRMRGSLPFRRQLAEFLGRRLAQRSLDPEQLVVLSGVGSILDVLFYTLGDPGDGVLIPTPSYAGFWMDLELRDKLRIVPVEGVSRMEFELGVEHYEKALQSASMNVRAVLLTNPDNPRGTLMDRDRLLGIVEWAESKGLHVIMDEVYAFSVFGSEPFESVLAMRASLGPNLHVVWGFSKDFAASGLRCGVLISENEEMLRAMDGLAYWSACSGDTQHLLGSLLADEDWVSRYLVEMPKRLRDSYQRSRLQLQALGIPIVEADAGFFFLADFRDHLPVQDTRAAYALWRRLLAKGNINFTPGAACRMAEPGFMRICHAAVDARASGEAFRRLAALV